MILWCAGSNARGQLATGDQEDRAYFQKSQFIVDDKLQSTPPDDILQVACGSNHTLALLRNQGKGTQIWGVGDGSKGQLGLTSSEKWAEFKPLDLGNLLSPNDEITMVQASWETSFAVIRSRPSDRIIAFGSNDFGILGINQDSIKQSLPREVVLDHLFTGQDTSYRISHFRATPRYVLTILRYETPEGGADMLIGWGAARHGQLQVRQNEDSSIVPPKSTPRWRSLPTKIWSCKHPTRVSSLAAGQQHGLILLNNGSILQLGSNSKSQLPSETYGEITIPRDVLCSWNNSFVLLNTSVIKSYGQSPHGQLGREMGKDDSTVPTPRSMDVKHIACGSEHCLIM